MSHWRDFVASRLEPLHNATESKHASLAYAVTEHVRHGMRLNFVALQSRPNQAMFEVCRQFNGTSPEFEVISSSVGSTSLIPIHLGLVRKAIISFAGESYPTPGPSPVIRRALEAGSVELENWTMLTISERLLGGAMGVPWFPTRSLTGSSIGAALKEKGLYREEIDSDTGEHLGLLKSYRPDISFVHAWMADEAGNAVCYPPYGENVYGALSAREGVILTADHIVPTETIRQHANLVRIPGEIVRSVSHVPYGCHPSGNFAQSIGDLRPYANDYDFMKSHRDAAKQVESYDAWIKEWVLDIQEPSDYVAKLGKERINYLHRCGESDAWLDELERYQDNLDPDRPASPIENMIVQASRVVASRMRERDLKTVLSGVGQATLMAWLAAHALRKEGHDITMMAETGIYGHDPRPADPFVFNFFNLHTTTVLTDIFETLGLHTGGAANRCMGTFGAGQIDRFGNVNSTLSADGSFIVGSGGANDISTAATESIVCAQQRLQTFVDEVEYITSPGKRIGCVVTTMGRFEKRGGDEFILTGYFGFDGLDCDAAVEEIKARCGWELQVAEDLEELSPATTEELMLLRLFDPQRFFLGKPAEKVEAVPAK